MAERDTKKWPRSRCAYTRPSLLLNRERKRFSQPFSTSRDRGSQSYLPEALKLELETSWAETEISLQLWHLLSSTAMWSGQAIFGGPQCLSHWPQDAKWVSCGSAVPGKHWGTRTKGSFLTCVGRLVKEKGFSCQELLWRCVRYRRGSGDDQQFRRVWPAGQRYFPQEHLEIHLQWEGEVAVNTGLHAWSALRLLPHHPSELGLQRSCTCISAISYFLYLMLSQLGVLLTLEEWPLPGPIPRDSNWAHPQRCLYIQI